MARPAWRILRLVLSVVPVAAFTALYSRVLLVNPTTVALSYVVVILLIATGWGIAEASVASLAAVLCFNFFFLPPVGTFTIADPENWVALVVFLLTAVIASQLSGRARRRTLEVLARQGDLERLYALSRALLLTESGPSIWTAIAQRVADAFQLPTVAFYDRQSDQVGLGGTVEVPDLANTLRDVARQAVSVRRPDGILVTAIRLGGAPIGSLALSDAGLTDTVLQSIANLAAIGVERARGQQAAARAEAARQSGELRAAVLDALAHEFKTPLTSMKAAAGDLLPSTVLGPRERELIAILDEDLDRLQTLVADAVQMLRIDAGTFVIHRGRQDLGEIVADTVRRFEARLDGHTLDQRVPSGYVIDVDRDLVGLALRQLVDNALKYSPANSTIGFDATTNGVATITVRNSGSTIPETEQGRVADRFYRGQAARHVPGTGMGLAIVRQIAEAHGGTLTMTSAAGEGTAFTLSLPQGEAPQ